MGVDVYLNGMGVVGSMLAWTCYREGISFLWGDNEHPYTAWKASTGLIYPCGEEQEQESYGIWARWYEGEAPWSERIPPVLEKGSFWFSSKNPPHGGKYPIEKKCGILSLASLPSYHVNVQRFVLSTRAFFADRQKEAPKSALFVESHGYSAEQFSHYLWGWSVKVHLRIHEALQEASPFLPSLYLRKGRFFLAYANPVPGEDRWYAGSSMIRQKNAHTLSLEKKFETWKDMFTQLANGWVSIEQKSPILQGWRPVGKTQGQAFVRRENTLYAPSLSGSGVRMAPMYCRSFLEAL